MTLEANINHYLLIIMHINLNHPADNLLSPLFQHMRRDSPYLSPIPNNALLKYQDPQDDFLHFELDRHSNFEQFAKRNQHLEEKSQITPLNPNDYLLDIPNHCEQNEVDAIKQEPSLNQHQITFSTPSSLETKTPLLAAFNPTDNSSVPTVQGLIEFLVQNSTLQQQDFSRPKQLWIDQNPITNETFTILLSKFKKLRKTKEEMTKYCMRKAFKFIADKMKKNKAHNRDVDSCMKLYFSKNQSGSNFTIPFKKNSMQKTMNGHFLKRVFSSQTFVEDYRQFLLEFRGLMIEDNDKKIKYLATLLQKYLAAQDLNKIEGIKRLPWTRQTLDQTQQLAMNLLEYAVGGTRREKIKQQ